ncbi:VTT domain-containing protein [uncultured Shewanella sp.]|uniref:3-dehydroquinate synthase family protein n=1 Tax=uncultured Shewanella sp. TaxID=173975 RepID=UPI002636C5A6|nr:VTT domain-containing protein [uncultured Shewanella sp.]
MFRSAHLCILLTSLTLMVILSFLFLEKNTTEIITSIFQKLQQENQQPYLSMIFLTAILSLNVILPVPDSLASVIATSHFNQFLAPTMICLGLTISAFFGYWLGGSLKKITFQPSPNYQATDKTQRGTHHASIILLILFRAIPVLAELSVITAGIIKLPFKQFIWIMSLSNIGLAIAYYQLGVLASSSHSILFLIIAGAILPGCAIAIQSSFYVIKSVLQYQRKRGAVNQMNRAPHTAKKTSSIQSSRAPKASYPIFFMEYLWSTHSNNHSPLLAFLNTQDNHSPFCCVIETSVLKKHPHLIEKIQDFFNFHSHLNLLCYPIITEASPTEIIKELAPFFKAKEINKTTLFFAIGTENIFSALNLTLDREHLKPPIVPIPSTLSAQAYTSIINDNTFIQAVSHKVSENAIPPLAIFNDFNLLTPIQEKEHLRGLVLIIKVALLKDAQFFNWIERNLNTLLIAQPNETQYAISRCTQLILQHIKSSSRFYHQEETSQLEYGQWSHQAISNWLTLPLDHAEVIATGILLDAYYSSYIGLLSEEYTLRIVNLFNKLGITSWYSKLKNKQKNKSIIETLAVEPLSDLSIPLLTTIGYSKTVHGIKLNVIEKVLNALSNNEDQITQLPLRKVFIS